MIKKIKENQIFVAWSFIVILHLLLLLKSNFFPYPELFVYPYLTKIGLVPYKQIFDQHFPGAMFFPVNFATLGIVTPQGFRVLQLLFVLISQIGLYKITKRLGLNNQKVLLVSFLYLVWQGYFEGGTLWIESMLVPLLIWSYYFLIKKQERLNKKDLLISGFLIGLSLVTKQIVVPLAVCVGIYLFLSERKNFAKISYWFVAAFVPVLLMLLFVFSRNIENYFFYWAGTFNFTAYHEMGRKFPTVKDLISTMFIALPAITGLFLILKRKSVSNAVLLGIYFITGFLYAYARFDYVHLQPVIPFAIIAIVYGFSVKKFNYLLVVFAVFSLLIGVRSYARNWGGEVKFFGSEDYHVFSEVKKFAPSGSSTFAFGTYPYLYPMTQTHPSGNVFVFQFPWFMKIAEENILDGLILDPPVVVVRDSSATTDGYNLIRYMPSISKFIDRYYVVEEKIGTTEIMTKRK